MAGLALLVLALVAAVAVVVALREDDGSADAQPRGGDAVDGIPLPRAEESSIRTEDGVR